MPDSKTDTYVEQYIGTHRDDPESRYAGALGRDILRESPDLTFEEFARRMDRTTEEIEKECAQFAKRMDAGQFWIRRLTETFLYRYHRPHDSLRIKLRSLYLTLETAVEWEKAPAWTNGEYSMHPKIFPGQHGEAMLGMEILHNKKLIGTLGGFLFIRNREPSFMNMNVQGKRLMEEEYDQAKQTLGENWRSYFMRRFAEYLHARGYQVMGSHNLLVLAEHLQRTGQEQAYFRQYNQTYAKAGFKRSRHHVKPDKNIWIWEKKPVSSRTKPKK